MTIDQQIAELRAAGRLNEYPSLAKLAAERTKASALLAELQAAQAEAARAAEPVAFQLYHEPQSATDVAVVSIDRVPGFQSPYVLPTGERVIPRMALGSVSFGPSWLADALDTLPHYAKQGWFVCPPRMVLDLYGTLRSSTDSRELESRFRAIVNGIRSVPVLSCMHRRLAVAGLSPEVAAAANIVANALSAMGHEPNGLILTSQRAEYAADEAKANELWAMIIGAASLPALPADPQTEIEQRTTAALIESQRISQARLAGAS